GRRVGCNPQAPRAEGNRQTSTDARSGWLRRLSRACWRYPRNVVLALGGTLVVSLVGITIPLIQRSIVDNLTSPAHPAIWPLAVGLLLAAPRHLGVPLRPPHP